MLVKRRSLSARTAGIQLFAALLLSVLPAAIATLPLTLELLVFQAGQRIGCVNGYGKFITTTASAEAGAIDCYEPVGAPAPFTLNGADLELVGCGTAFSAPSIPATDDRTGVDIIVGSGGSEQFFLQVHSVSG
ncbi:hypothetical protein F4819DRAFT_501607 [Hypoxylon fuscum]|nr:hypothetical protein F4819DRAFT_501607 [Hypoxylon fuscum]